MAGTPTLRTARLLLREWREEDRPALAAMHDDPQVMRFLPARLSREESDALMDRMRAEFAARGFGRWAVEIRGVAPLAGLVGLGVPRFDAPFAPAVEIAWRLARRHWGHGYATEAAGAALAFGFRHARLGEIVAFAAAANTRSRAVMARLGMQHDPCDDFEHPLLPPGHPLRPHVLYRLTRGAWARRTGRPR